MRTEGGNNARVNEQVSVQTHALSFGPFQFNVPVLKSHEGERKSPGQLEMRHFSL